MFARWGGIVGRAPGRWLIGWLAAVVLLFLLRPAPQELARCEPHSLLPSDQPYNRALAFERRAFARLASRTRTVLIFEAAEGLSPSHERFLRQLSARLVAEHASQHDWTIQSPFAEPFLARRLRSADGAAAMIVVNSPTHYLTRRSVSEVELLDSLARESLPEGLRLEVTGEGGLGRDLSAAIEGAFDRTTAVTLLALMVILALVYRAPLAAIVPLAAIALSVVAAIMLLDQLTRLGWGISTFEKTITVVLLFGSGTDFALFWLADFRERVATAPSRLEAATMSTWRTGPAILGSAATTICGLLMLMSADLLPSFNAGRALAVSLAVSLVAALTLVPALAMLLGRALYWPRKQYDQRRAGRQGAWSTVARAVVARPAVALAVCVLLFFGPAYHGWCARYTYDALGVVPADSSATRGEVLAREHFAAEQLFSWTCMIEAEGIADDFDGAVARSQMLTDACRSIPGVVDVWSLAQPLGASAASPLAALVSSELGRRQAAPFYLAPQAHALRLEILLGDAPLSEQAMASCTKTLETLGAWAKFTFADGARIHATGLTPYILNIKAVSDQDSIRVIVLVIAVIFVIVLALVRDLVLTGVMLAATLIVYLVTLGATEWFFVEVCGESGIDWKVKLFAFVILVAVGQDYNIFLVTRMLQERRRHDLRVAAQRAIAGTGSVISSCGVIMAATLGSLAATGLPFFQELGMAFALGVLVDTFVIRPVFVPATYLLLRGGARRT